MTYDYNIIVIGAGAGGLVSSYIGAAVNAKVALIEKHKMGGDCLNTGCVPSKALIRSSKMISYAKRSREFGIEKADLKFEFADIMARVRSIIKDIEPHDSVERYTKLGVDCFTGIAKIIDKNTVEVNGEELTTKNIIIATGARPFVPPIPGLDKINYLTSDNIWELKKLPKKLVVLGGGPIGCELAQCFARLGSKVTQVEMADKLLIREDEEVSDLVTQRFGNENINVLTSHRAKEVKGKSLICEYEGKDVKISFDNLLVAIGRKANVEGFGLEELGVELSDRGTIKVDKYLRTNIKNIYAVGDVAGPYQFTHTAAHMAWYAAINSLFGSFKKFKIDYSIIPWVTFTDPEIARVGLNEQEAKAQNIPYEVTIYSLDDLDRAITDQEAYGFVKVLTKPKKDKILGVTIAGHNAGEILPEFVLAMKHNIGLNKILGTIHPYPTWNEANKYVAGNWKKSHKPERVLNWLKTFHQWRRK